MMRGNHHHFAGKRDRADAYHQNVIGTVVCVPFDYAGVVSFIYNLLKERQINRIARLIQAKASSKVA
jgi:hypothetical protein